MDTYGLMHNEESLRYFDLLDHNLDKDILLGYHTHNNFQLAYANTIEIIKQKTNRGLLIDGTVYGMGKAAGNAPTELLAMHLNENYSGNYDLNQILEIADTNILSIYREHYWGYSFLYYLSASNDCHPNYIRYLLDKKTLSVTNINEIIKRIEDDYKLDYNREYIEELYIQYQKRYTSSNGNFTELLSLFKGQQMILLGPGHSVKDSHDIVSKRINESEGIVISVNCLPDDYSINFVFINNAKRYSLLSTQLKKRTDIKIITTSNILSTGNDFNYVINYESFLDEESIIRDNALVMFLNLLHTAQVRNILLAGFDGFSTNVVKNYYDDFLKMSFDPERMQLTNQAISKKLAVYRNTMDVEFITDSLY